MKKFFTLFFSCTIFYALNGQTEPRLVLPIGHTDGVISAVFSPDGKYALTASLDATARVYDVSTGYELMLIKGHQEGLVSAVFSPNGRLVLTASEDETARVFDLSRGEVINILDTHEDELSSASFSPDGKLILTASYDHTARIYSVTSGKELRILIGHGDELNSAEFSSDGQFAVTSSCDSTARIYEVSTGREVHVLHGHEDWVKSAVFSNDGKLVVTASYDKTARIYDAFTGRMVQVLEGHNDGVMSALFSPDSRFVLTSSEDGSVRIYDVLTGNQIRQFSTNQEVVIRAIFSSDGRFVLTACGDGTARIYDASSGQEIHVLSGHKDYVNSAVFSPDGKWVLTASEDETARIYEVSSGRQVHVLQGLADMVNSAVFSSDGKWSLTASRDNTARIYDVSSGREVQVLSGHTESVRSAVFSSDGLQVLTASDDHTARIYNISSGKLLKVLVGHTQSLNSATFSSDDRMVLTASNDSTARIFDVYTGKVLQVMRHSSYVETAFFSPNGNIALTVGWDGPARLYDVANGKLLRVLPEHKRIISAIFSPDGRFVLTTNKDRSIRVFEVITGKEFRLFKENIFGLNSASFSFDGNELLISKWDDYTARVYNFESGQIRILLRGHEYDITSAVFSPDGKHILTTGADHKTILWDAAAGKALYTRLQLKGNDWLVYDEHYRFDGTPGAIEKLYFVCGLEVVELGQMKDALYVPGLADKIIKGEDINYKKLSELDICGALPVIDKKNETQEGWTFSIEQRRWPIVRLEVKVDGKSVKTIPAEQLKFSNSIAELKLSRVEMQHHFTAGNENKLSVIAITEENGIEYKSRGVLIDVVANGEKQDPNLYMLMIGVNDYKDDALDLRFPVQDARAFGSALESSARKLLGNDKVFVYNVQSKTDNTAVYTTPERAGVMKALEEIGSKAKTNDVLFIFFAGHGVMQGADNTFTFLTADASKLNPVGISTTDLKSWLSPEGPFRMMPNKTVLVYDACNSGQAAKEIMADLAMARDDDATERQRQIEDLGDKQGVFILSASAPNQSAYELPHLGQGMLTYSLLTTLKNNPAVLDEDKNGKGFLNLQKWFLETEREQSRLMQSLGLNQDAQPYGTANIRIGLVDDEVRNGISLMAEKPLVHCSNARDDNDEDPLELKQAVNTYLETATTRGTSSKLGYIKAETSQANIVKLVYSVSGDKVQCRILIFKNKVKINELNITTTSGEAAEDVVKAVEDYLQLNPLKKELKRD